MSAYSIALKISCDASGCASRATHAVHNTFNSCVGNFCARHTKKRLADLHRSEVAVVRSVVSDRKAP